MFVQNISQISLAHLFKKSPVFDIFFDTESVEDIPIDFGKIRCPLCRWQPKASSRWYCSDFGSHYGCGTAWNTFDTRGICPGCQFQWRWTDCLRCARSSPHEDWYQEKDD